ncbi:PRC-barrel domain-containing protein [Roseibium polysiphoniae]|nr:PRC-barrel domain-containing protein [Roseibium polysiphoniae]
MLRTILATTALATVLSTNVMAETKPLPKETQVQSEMRDDNVYLFDFDTLSEGPSQGYLASNLIGKYIYTSSADDADTVGDINDIVIGENGETQAVIVGVGGFLGIGEKDVAIDFNRLSMSANEDDEIRVTSDVTKEELDGASQYERPDHVPGWANSGSVRDEMDKVAGATKDTYNTVRNEAADSMNGAADTITMEERWMDGKTPVQNAAVTTDNLLGASVYNAGYEEIGEISEALVKTNGQIDAAVLDIGGFLGMGEKPVAVGFEDLKIYQNDDGDLFVATPFTKEELENAATYDAATYKQQRENMLLGS